TRLMKRQLLRSIVQRGVAANRLRHFASVAETAGLIDLLESFIAEMKQREVWPEQFAETFSDDASVRHQELAWLYAEYQRLLQDHQLYDAEGRFWTARALLREGQLRPFEHLECLIADGFTDFTRTQHEILAILSERIAEVLISLPIEA